MGFFKEIYSDLWNISGKYMGNTWVNFITTSLRPKPKNDADRIREIIPSQAELFRLVNYRSLSRLMLNTTWPVVETLSMPKVSVALERMTRRGFFDVQSPSFTLSCPWHLLCHLPTLRLRRQQWRELPEGVLCVGQRDLIDLFLGSNSTNPCTE